MPYQVLAHACVVKGPNNPSQKWVVQKTSWIDWPNQQLLGNLFRRPYRGRLWAEVRWPISLCKELLMRQSQSVCRPLRHWLLSLRSGWWKAFYPALMGKALSSTMKKLNREEREIAAKQTFLQWCWAPGVEFCSLEIFFFLHHRILTQLGQHFGTFCWDLIC